jgi:hypothetical protein
VNNRPLHADRVENEADERGMNETISPPSCQDSKRTRQEWNYLRDANRVVAGMKQNAAGMKFMEARSNTVG